MERPRYKTVRRRVKIIVKYEKNEGDREEVRCEE
jgi:hypothetical protein